MSNIVKYTQFKHVAESLWNKAKEKFAKLDESNIFTSENIFKEKTLLMKGYVPSEKLSLINPSNFNSSGQMGNTSFTVYEDIKAPANTNVTRLVVGMHDNVNVGDKITNIALGVANITTNPTNPTVGEYILENYSAVVMENTIIDSSSGQRLYPISNSKVVVLPVNRKWTYDALFIVCVPNMIWGGRSTTGYTKRAGGGTKPGVGQTFQYETGHNMFIGRIVVYGEDTLLSTAVKNVDYIGDQLTVTKIDGTSSQFQISTNTGGITNVNGQQGPTVTLTASDINATGGTVQEKLNSHQTDIDGLKRNYNPRVGDIVLRCERVTSSFTRGDITYLPCLGYTARVQDYPTVAGLLNTISYDTFIVPNIAPVDGKFYYYIVAKTGTEI